MSRKAKKLLDGMIGWAGARFVGAGVVGKFWKNIGEFSKEFHELFSPLLYEDVCQRFKIDVHLTALKRPKADCIPGTFKTKQEVLDAMMLQHFNNQSWLKDSGLLDNDRRVRLLMPSGLEDTLRAQAVYDWLTGEFLITDFSEDDVNKISALAGEEYSLDTIKREARKIGDVDKRSIPYLYAIVRDVTVKEQYSKQKTAEVRTVQENKLQSIIDLAVESKNKLVHQFDPDMRERWDRDREFQDLARELKNKS